MEKECWEKLKHHEEERDQLASERKTDAALVPVSVKPAVSLSISLCSGEILIYHI